MDFSDGELEPYLRMIMLSRHHQKKAEQYAMIADDILDDLMIKKRIASFDDKRG